MHTVFILSGPSVQDAVTIQAFTFDFKAKNKYHRDIFSTHIKPRFCPLPKHHSGQGNFLFLFLSFF